MSTITRAVRSGAIVVDGSPALVREFPRWLMWSPMAHHVRVARDRPNSKSASRAVE
jgi:hypothetical protein